MVVVSDFVMLFFGFYSNLGLISAKIFLIKKLNVESVLPLFKSLGIMKFESS